MPELEIEFGRASFKAQRLSDLALCVYIYSPNIDR